MGKYEAPYQGNGPSGNSGLERVYTSKDRIVMNSLCANKDPKDSKAIRGL